MAQLYLSRKWIGSQQLEALLGAGASDNNLPAVPPFRRISSKQSGSIVTSKYTNDNDVEDLEMLLEAYFMQLDGTRNKILSVSTLLFGCAKFLRSLIVVQFLILHCTSIG